MLSLREKLDIIDTWLYEESQTDTSELRAVLSAIRGPDNGNYTLKQQTTACVRALAFPKDAAGPFCPWDVQRGIPQIRFTKFAWVSNTVGWHFKSHIYDAMLALGDPLTFIPEGQE